MNKSSRLFFLLFLGVVLGVQAALLLGKGSLLIDRHEGDALHLLQITMRMSEGQWPHLDFMTPIGVLAFAPVSWLLSLGVGPGHSVMGGQVLFGLFLLPLAWWAATTRLTPKLAYCFGAIEMVLATSMVHGGADQAASISMYYNRWAWGIAFVVILMSVLKAKRGSNSVDGLVLGAAMAFLALSKITFFVALFPGVAIALLIRRQFKAILFAALTGGVAATVVTLSAGTEFWLAYIGDLQTVSTSGIRPQPGDSFAYLMVGPPFIVASFCLLAGIIFLRQAGRMTEGVILAVFAPALVYITYQNWGNDPQWLMVYSILLFALLPERVVHNGMGWDVGRAQFLMAVVAAALILPSAYNITFSTLRHARLSPGDFSPIFDAPDQQDIAMHTQRMYLPAGRVAINLPDDVLAAHAPTLEISKRDELFGKPLDFCKLEMGSVGLLRHMAAKIEQTGELTGKTIFMADTFSNIWLFGSTEPLRGGSPWYYGGDAGLSVADYVLVPMCPLTSRARSQMLEEMAGRADLEFAEVDRNDLYILLRRTNP